MQNYGPHNPRSVHGGEDSHLSVEVSAWREDGDAITVCNDEPLKCDGFGVYIRNPLAFHINDIAREKGAEGYSRAKRAAFTYADALADHLGCEVVSALPRPDIAPAAPEPISTSDLIEAAACLWEAVLDLKARGAGKDDQPIDRAFDGTGWAQMRMSVIGWAEYVHRDWEEAQRLTGYDAPFDWDFCPDWIALNVTFDEHGADLASVRKCPEMSQPEPVGDFPYAKAHEAGCEALGRGTGVPDCITMLAAEIDSELAGKVSNPMIAALGGVLLNYRAAAKGGAA